MSIDNAPVGIRAGLWPRIFATLIDLVTLCAGAPVLGVIATPFIMVLGMEPMKAPLTVATLAWCVLYEPVMYCSRWEATVGKRVLSLVVRATDGSRVSFAQALHRRVLKLIFNAIGFFGVRSGIFVARGQPSMHDWYAKTEVFKLP